MSFHFTFRPWRPRLMFVAVLVGFLLYYGLQHGWLQRATRTAELSQPGLYAVSNFVDGDTITVHMNGHLEKVRFIGVDTPETHKPNTPVQCYGPAAAVYTKQTIGNHMVRLVSDPLSTDRDRYNRLLRYVYVADGTFVNKQLIENGYGFYYPYFPFSKSAEFNTAERVAISRHLGLWGQCKPTPTDIGGYISNNQT